MKDGGLSVRLWSLLLGATLVASTLGCGSSTTDDAEGAEFRMLTRAYVQFVRASDGKPPKDLEEFQSHVSKSLADYLQSQDRTVEQLFTSPRDEHPYVFFTQQNRPPAGSDVIGYEQTGRGGRRYVGDSSGSVFEATEEMFRKLVPGKNES